MSDYILKFWPTKKVEESKIELIKKELINSMVISDETEFWGKPAFNPGQKINEFLSPKLERSNPYFESIKITIEEKSYGVKMGVEDFEYIDRKNVVSIKGGEGGFEEWSSMCKLLEGISGDEYEGGWELL